VLTGFSQAQCNAAQAWFARTPVDFLKGVVDVAGLPAPDRPEIAFAGRSNVGKSSLLNALVNRRDLARTSQTPGRTQEINFFTLGQTAHLVDLPGYGYAQAPKAKVDQWNRLILDYLRGRSNLARVILLLDGRHGMKPADLETMGTLDAAAVPYQAVLTKLDKVGPQELAKRFEEVASALSKRPAAYPLILGTSSQKRLGLEGLRAQVASLIDPATFGSEPAGDTLGPYDFAKAPETVKKLGR